jgi:small subunit ribosomal protein S6
LIEILSIFAAQLKTMPMLKQYETVFIMTPVLSEDQMKEAVGKFKAILTENGAKLVHEENWGLRKLAYPIQKKTTGFYHLLEFQAATELIAKLETEFKRDERIIRFLTVALDKNAIAYNEKKRTKGFEKTKTETPAEA